MNLILDSLALLSFVFEILALILAFYFKENKIFFISLALVLARLLYIYTDTYNANLFLSLSLPLVFTFFVVLPKNTLVFEKKNLSQLIILAFMAVLALLLSKNADFITNIKEKIFGFTFFEPMSEISFIFFALEFLLIFLYSVKKDEYHYCLAFVLLFGQFLFASFGGVRYFEFASFYFIFIIFFQAYTIAFHQPITKLGNLKAMKRFILGLDEFIIICLSFDELKNLELQSNKKRLKKVAHFLRKQDKKLKIFNQDHKFYFIINAKEKPFFEARRKDFEDIEFKRDKITLKAEFKILEKEKLLEFIKEL